MVAAHRTACTDAAQATLLVLGHVLTLDPTCPRTSALAIRDGRIVAHGPAAWALASPDTPVLDCGTRTILPGLIDAHLHLLALASSTLTADCRAARSIAEIQAIVGRAAAALPAGAWVRASGYREDHLVEQRHPTRWELDAAAPSHPVRLRHASRHASVLNSRALALAGLDRHAPDPPGSFVARDPTTGEPTGLIVDAEAWLSQAVVPRRGEGEMAAALATASAQLLAAGITTVHDLTATNTLATFEQLARWRAQGALRVRVVLYTAAATLDERCRLGTQPGRGDPWLAWGGLKLLLGQAAGALTPPLPTVIALVREAQRRGFPVALHAIEPEEVLAAAEACAQARAAGRLPWPHRIEHAAICPPGFAERIATSGAAVVTQPAFIYWRGDHYRTVHPRAIWRWLYAARTLRQAGIRLAAGSDAPVVPPDPLVALRAVTTRQTASGQVLAVSERLSLRQALSLFTTTAAALGGQRDRGHLGRSALADLVVLDGRLADLRHPDRPLPRVVLTLCGGEIAFAAPDAPRIDRRRTACL